MSRASRPLWFFGVSVPAAVAGMYVAASIVPGFRIEAGGAARILVAAALAAIFTVATAVLALSAAAAASAGLLADTMRGVEPVDPFDEDEEGADDATPAPRTVVALLLLAGVQVLTVAVALPAALWLAVWVCRTAGAPVDHVGGWGPYLCTAVVARAVHSLVRAVLRPPSRPGRWRAWAAALLHYGAAAAVLGVATTFAGGVRLESDRPAGVALIVLAAMVVEVRMVPAGRAGAYLQAPVDVLALAVTVWLTTWLAVHLRFDGPLPLVLTGVALTVAALPARRLSPPAPVAGLVTTTGRFRRRR